jgi:hypothetical protein
MHAAMVCPSGSSFMIMMRKALSVVLFRNHDIHETVIIIGQPGGQYREAGDVVGWFR